MRQVTSATPPLLLILSSLSSCPNVVVSAESTTTSILIEDYGETPMLEWYTINDPVMGGLSFATVTVEDGLAKFSGMVEDVPSLQAPGFVAMRSGDGSFPDVSSCGGIAIEARSNTDYGGYRFDFSPMQAESTRYARGFKTPFNVGKEFETIKLPFGAFSDNWDGRTGDIRVLCADDPSYCPSRNTLQNLGRMEIMGEGVKGVVDLEVKSVSAYDCVESRMEMMENKAAVPLSAVAMVISLLSLFFVWRMRMKERKGVQMAPSSTDAKDNELL